MAAPTRVWLDRRRQHQERTYEELIVKMAKEVVNPATTEKRRTVAQDSLLNACVRFSEFHNLNAAALYWGAIRRAKEGTS
jgi:hypothetical protein